MISTPLYDKFFSPDEVEKCRKFKEETWESDKKLAEFHHYATFGLYYGQETNPYKLEGGNNNE